MFRNRIGRMTVGAGEGRHFRADQLSAAADGIPSAQLQQGHPHPHALFQGRLSPQVHILTLMDFLDFFSSMYCIEHCFICRPSDRTQDCSESVIGSQTL